MRETVKIIAIGDALGIELSQEVLNALGAEVGDTLSISATREGIELKPLDTIQGRVMRKVMDDHREVLSRLAKS